VTVRLEASGHNWVEGQGSGPRIDKAAGEEEDDQYDAMGNKIDTKKAEETDTTQYSMLPRIPLSLFFLSSRFILSTPPSDYRRCLYTLMRVIPPMH
jgi:hypothetical protein